MCFCGLASLTSRYCFQTAVSLCPNEGHSKYMYLGQLSSGQEAVSYFTKGIEIMSSLLKGEEVGVKGGIGTAGGQTSILPFHRRTEPPGVRAVV